MAFEENDNLSSQSGVISVSDLNRQVRELLQNQFPMMWISGELSNVTLASSGHYYFSLKDAGAQVRCAMFKGRAQYLGFKPREGMQVEVYASVGLYAPRGDFQLTVDNMREAGAGRLYAAFAALKAKLEAEGWLAPERKRAIPTFVRQLGIVTSLQAAALRDVLTTLKRRMPNLPVIIYPAPVQGDGSAQKIAAMIALANTRQECDVLLVCRGGGSIEDLWAFNEPEVAYAIAESSIPVVSGVGHETDFTIADFVADQRAPTPTAAAELVSVDTPALRQNLQLKLQRLQRLGWQNLQTKQQQLDWLAQRLKHPRALILAQKQALQQKQWRLQQLMQMRVGRWQVRLTQSAGRLRHCSPPLTQARHRCQQLSLRLHTSMQQLIQITQQRLARAEQALQLLNPQEVLLRGYTIVADHTGEVRSSMQACQLGESLQIQFSDGRVWTEVLGKQAK